jgi:hypothetical protein
LRSHPSPAPKLSRLAVLFGIVLPQAWPAIAAYNE